MDHVADSVHDEGERFSRSPENHGHERSFLVSILESHASPEIDGGDDLAAEIDEAANRALGEGNRRDRCVFQDLLDLSHLDTEKEIARLSGCSTA